MAGPQASSSLSSLSERSSPNSFATAAQTPGGIPKNEDHPMICQGVDDAAMNRPSAYRDAAPLRRELEAQCKILLEEQLYAKAIFMLNQMLISGHTRKDGLRKPATVAPSGQLALLSTLTVHPHRTTRLKDYDEGVVVGDTWNYLKNVLAIVGPVNAEFKTAFAFRGPYRPNRRHAAAGDEDDDGIDEDKIYLKYANEESLYHLAEDFWHVVGWAFNCSDLHAHRWPHWKLWLDFMVEGIAADWSQRALLDAQGPPQADGQPCITNRMDSLLMIYTNHMRVGRPRMSRTLKAIFADGSQTSRRLFKEIFHNEPKQITQADRQEAQDIPTKVDVEQGEYGGYMDLTDSDNDLNATDQSPWATPQTPRQLDHEDLPDSVVEATPLRLRVFALVVKAALALPSALADFENVFEEFVRHLKDLPPPRLQLFLALLREMAASDEGEVSNVVEVLGILLDDLLPSAYEDPAAYDDSAKGVIVFTAETLTRSFLPWPANTNDLDDNVRLTLVLETALMLIPVDDPEMRRGSLRAAAAKGIEARSNRVKRLQGKGVRGARKKGTMPSGRELYLREMMDLSGERMLAYIDGMDGVDAL
ncbi:hypothetical protein ACHAQH_009795 [Verticillium albo-atrum]